MKDTVLNKLNKLEKTLTMIVAAMATKQDLKALATKDDLKRESIKIQNIIIREVKDLSSFIQELDKRKAEKTEVVQLEQRVEKIEKELHAL